MTPDIPTTPASEDTFKSTHGHDFGYAQLPPLPKSANLELYTDLRHEFDKLDTLFSRSISKTQPLSRPLVSLRRKIRLARIYEVIKDGSDSSSGDAFRSLAAHAYSYYELILKLEKAQYLTREKAQKLAIRTARILELTDPKVTRLFGVID